MNGDGFRDIVSGSWPGRIYVIAGCKNGKFLEPRTLKDRNGEEINPDYATAVAINDFDQDGDMDLVVGTISGEVYFVANEGGSFGKAVALMANGEHIMADHGGPALADWDGNGTLDLLIAEGSGRVRFYPNKSNKGFPEFGEAVVLVPESEGVADAPGLRAKIDVADWNSDGKLDLLLGDFYWEQGEAIEMTEADLKAKAEAEVNLKPIFDEYLELCNKITEECLDKMGFSDMSQLNNDRKLVEKLHQLMEEANKDSEELKTLEARMRPYQEILAKYRVSNSISGKVWVFLRKS